MKRTCYNCAYVRETHFKKFRSRRTYITGEKKSRLSPHYGKVIYWCKKGPNRNPNSYKFAGCDKHETKAERRVINDKIKEKIYLDTMAKRLKDKSW